jgi:osmotically inducible lipoprotein OsmB
MHKYLIVFALASTTLAGCMQTPTERGLVGAVAGAAIADSMDENMVAGAALGGLAGAATCGIPGLPRCTTY